MTQLLASIGTFLTMLLGAYIYGRSKQKNQDSGRIGLSDYENEKHDAEHSIDNANIDSIVADDNAALRNRRGKN